MLVEQMPSLAWLKRMIELWLDLVVGKTLWLYYIH